MRARKLSFLPLVFALAACDKSGGAPAPTETPDEPAAPAVSESDPGPGPTHSDVDPQAPTADDPTEDDGADAQESAVHHPGDPVSVPEDPADGLTEPTSFADLKIEIKRGSKVHRDPGKVIRWDELTRIPIEIDGQQHEFIVHVSRSGGAAEVMMSYNRDGAEILRKYTFDAKIKKREVLRIDDGTALAVTVNTKTIKPRTSDHQKVDKVEGDDPLAGAGKKGEPGAKKKAN